MQLATCACAFPDSRGLCQLTGYFLLLLQCASSLYTKFSLALAPTFDGHEEGSGKELPGATEAMIVVLFACSPIQCIHRSTLLRPWRRLTALTLPFHSHSLTSKLGSVQTKGALTKLHLPPLRSSRLLPPSAVLPFSCKSQVWRRGHLPVNITTFLPAFSRFIG